MDSHSFLEKIALKIIEDYHDLAEITIVLPNKRAKLFLIEALKKYSPKSFFSPEIISVEQFIEEVSGYTIIEPIPLLFNFYEVYKKFTQEEKQQTFEVFSNWANTLLADFNEIDRYNLNPDSVFQYLIEVEALKRWELAPQDRTKLIEEQLQFWAKLPEYYSSLSQALVLKKQGYQGKVYKEASEKIQYYCQNNLKKHFVFAGFNAFNQSEEKIITHMLSQGNTKVYWDIDSVFVNDPYHDAGYFIRNYKKNWSYFKTHPFEWITNDFENEKKIQFISTPKKIGQAKIAAQLIEEIQKNKPNLEKTAIILGDEALLIPLLHALPKNIDALNITMGLPLQNHSIQILIDTLFLLHINALKRGSKAYYYKELVTVLENPNLGKSNVLDNIIFTIKSNNFTYVSLPLIKSLFLEEIYLFELLFTKWNDSKDIVEVVDSIIALLLFIKSQLEAHPSQTTLDKVYLFAIYKAIQQLKNYIIASPNLTLESLYEIYKQTIRLQQVDFEGQPLLGLQIMGVLESRVLDFETVIITSLNEGIFPAGKSNNSFIPLDIKKILGLPTFKEKDAIYTYHFYHAIQRAKNVFLIYNSDVQGTESGERSRYLTQLEFEKQDKHNIETLQYSAEIPQITTTVFQVEKSKTLLDLIKQRLEKGISPSALTTYIRNPLQFYKQKILYVNEIDDVEENIEARTLGNIIHKVLELLYLPYLNKTIEVFDCEEMLLKMDTILKNVFKNEFKEGDISRGKNLLSFEIAKETIKDFLTTEKNQVSNGDKLQILFLEKKIETILDLDHFGFPIKLVGAIDRIEMRNNIIRLVDYKTGKVEPKNLKIKTWDGLTNDISNDKIIQLLCYAIMVKQELGYNHFETGIYSFKNKKDGFMPLQIINNTSKEISEESIFNFKQELFKLIAEILSPETPFIDSEI